MIFLIGKRDLESGPFAEPDTKARFGGGVAGDRSGRYGTGCSAHRTIHELEMPNAPRGTPEVVFGCPGGPRQERRIAEAHELYRRIRKLGDRG